MKLKLKKFICGVNNMYLFIALHKYFPSLKAGYVLRILLLPIYIWFYLFRLIFVAKEKESYSHNLGLCLIIKDEANCLEEWIEYHRLLGVDIFYIFDNGSKDNIKEVLSPYIESDLVKYQLLEGRGRQLDAYNICLRKYKKEVKYIGFIDVDEFIYIKEKSLLSFIDKTLKTRKKSAGIGLNWVIFGSNGIKEKNSELVTKKFLRRSNFDFVENHHIKTIVNPRKVLAMVNPHYVAYLRGYKTISINGEEILDAFYENTSNMDKVRLNHYYCKSREEYLEKCNRGLADQTRKRDDLFDKMDKNDVYDDSILEYSNSL